MHLIPTPTKMELKSAFYYFDQEPEIKRAIKIYESGREPKEGR